MSQKNVLITGGAGYIGSVLIPKLLEEGFAVTALDLFPRGDTVLASCCANPHFTPVKGDVRDEKLVGELLKKCDIAIPLAALVGAPLCKRDPFNAQTINSDAIQITAGAPRRQKQKDNLPDHQFRLWHRRERFFLH